MFDDDDPRIVAECPVDLTVADVERDDACGAALEEHVCEAARGRADVERLAAFDRDVERVEGMRQLDAATADIRVIGRNESELGVVVDLRAGFRLELAVNKDLPRQNQGACALS